jgi:uncharacterized membrane protein
LKSILNFIQRWGLSLTGILLIICGLIYTTIPQKAPYQGISKAFLAHYLSGRGMGYLQLEKSSALYIVNEGDYLPAFSSDYLNHGNVLISFLYRSDETTSIDVSSDNHVHLVGQAFPVVRITLYHQFGQQPVVFSSHEYSQNPDGYYKHNWVIGIGLSILGIIFIGLGYFITVFSNRKKKQLYSDGTQTKRFKEVHRQPEKVIQSK